MAIREKEAPHPMISEIRANIPVATTEGCASKGAATCAPEAPAAPAAPADSAQLSAAPRRSFTALRAAVAREAASLEKKLPEHFEGEVLVRTKEGMSAVSFAQTAEFFGLEVVEKFDIPENMRANFKGDLYLLRAGNDLRASEAISLLSKEPGVASVSSNDVLKLVEPVEKKFATPPAPQTLLQETPTETIPNDLDSRLWGMKNSGQDGGKAGADISATTAWGVQTGKTDGPVVAVIDTGIDYRHPDLANNIWNNPDASAPDRHGYNFVGNRPDPMDDHSHGTHCSGTIAGEGNNGQGVVGVNWHAQLMGLKFLSASGSGSTADAVRAVLYASEHGARITSNSWGGGGFNQALYDALKASPALHIFAAGNSRNDNDRSPSYPATYDLDNIVAVAASDRNDQKASFSNYGKRTVDLAAPGKDILSTTPNNQYASYSGTSMATPHVAGAAALIASQFPNISNEQLKSRLMNSVDKLPEWNNLVAAGGRLNAAAGLEVDEVAPATPGDFKAAHVGATHIHMQWSASGDDNWTGNASSYDLRFSERPIKDGPDGCEGSVSFEAASPGGTSTPQSPGSVEDGHINLPPSGQARTFYVALKIRDNVGNASVMTTKQVTVPAATVAFEDRMENGTENWIADAPWATVAEEGRGNVWASATNGTQENDANTSLATKTIDLSTIRNASLNFDVKKELEEGFDFLNVEISEDGQTWTTLDKSSGSADWTLQTIDLQPYEGKTVQVRFRVQTDASVNSGGVRIDNVVVAGDPA
ncbi:MAG: hypothetical protein FJX76_14770 [Armatimonadetes bacterium]|nr:hypothetical protein [Armatimonadota bacterium]